MTSPARPFRLRRLTAGERALAAEVFGAALDASRVRILPLPLWSRAFVAGPGLIVWPAARLPADFADAPLHTQAVLVHELTHVWQAQRGTGLLRAKLRAGDSAASYDYGAPDAAFEALNIEQQATFVEHAFLAARGGATPHPAHVYAAVDPVWRHI